MAKRLSRFVMLSRYEDGTTFFAARSKKYRGFMHHLRPGEDRKRLHKAFKDFKRIVDDTRTGDRK